MGGGPPGFRPGYTCPVLLWIHSAYSQFRLRDLYPLRSDFPILFGYRSVYVMSVRNPEDKSSVWPLPRSLAATRGIDVSFSSSGYLDVSVPRVTSSMAILFTIGYLSITLSEFPHSEICGLTDICSCPQLIAACHVLLRLPVPRHPPCALCCLTNSPTLAFV